MSIKNGTFNPEIRYTPWNPAPPPALVEFMASGWLDIPLPSNPHPENARFRSRRDRLSSEFPGEYLLVDSEQGDAQARFSASSSFAYLVAPGEPGALLVLEPNGSSHRSILFVPEHNRGKIESFRDAGFGELWVGRHRGVIESQSYYGVDECKPLGQIGGYLDSIKRSGIPTRLVSETGQYSLRFESDSEFETHIHEMRLIKDDYERSELRKAVEITKRGLEDALRVMRPGARESGIEAAFLSRAYVEANDVAFTIAAAGNHASSPHWARNGKDGELKAGELVKMDVGVERDSLYKSDVTRTFPISGTFSPEQRAVYQIVYEAQQAGIEAVRPGNDFAQLTAQAMRVLSEGLIDLGILRCTLDEALDPERQYYKRYALHGVSHMLGLDGHDCGKARPETYHLGKLREGMFLTVEPGLYFQVDDGTVPERFRGIGVRIEDDVAVTADGRDNYSAIVPSRPDDVERWIAELRA